MPSFAISKFTVLLKPLWVSAEFLLLSTGPIYCTLSSFDRKIVQSTNIWWNGGGDMSRYEDFLKEQLTNPEIKAEYEALEPEFAAIRAALDAQQLDATTK